MNTLSAVESSLVKISRMRGTINNRVTISPTISSGNTSLILDYLMQGDVGSYICNVTILDTYGSQSAEIQSIASKLSRPSKHALYHILVRTYIYVRGVLLIIIYMIKSCQYTREIRVCVHA